MTITLKFPDLLGVLSVLLFWSGVVLLWCLTAAGFPWGPVIGYAILLAAFLGISWLVYSLFKKDGWWVSFWKSVTDDPYHF